MLIFNGEDGVKAPSRQPKGVKMRKLQIFGLLAILVSLLLVSQPSQVFAQRIGGPYAIPGNMGSSIANPNGSSDMGLGTNTGQPREGFKGDIGNEKGLPGGAGNMDGSENGPLGGYDSGHTRY
jgi:hypothetical protein